MKKNMMKKQVKIAILGAPINNGNMGCLALTYSLLAMLEEISIDLGEVFTYYNFEGVEDVTKTKALCRNLGIDESRIKSFNIYPLESFLGFCHRPHKVWRAYSALKECDLFIDMTQGDSFSDIYGDSVFNKNANGKLLVEKLLKKPLILGPQTYGPYQKDRNRKKAKETIEAASMVIARDDASAQYVKSFSDKEVHVTTDLAFGLPYVATRDGAVMLGGGGYKTGRKIRVGVNISGLLVKDKIESTPTYFKLKADYDAYIEQVLSWLSNQNYEVYLIPHVEGETDFQRYKQKFPDVGCVEMYSDPISIKSRIAEMDVFIGARMHATIGAFSSGVATIPTAYSRKFNGLYEGLQYPYVVDLLNESTEECIEKTVEYIESFGILQRRVKERMKRVNVLTAETKRLFKIAIAGIIGK